MEEEWPDNEYEDPVCGMKVNMKTAPAEAEYKGQTYYFCAPMCRDKFLEDPEKYLDSGGREKSSS